MAPKGSICIFAYNHEKFIAQAIESVLIQKTNFDYEVVIGEDCSSDRTREIVIDYQKKYPDKIRLILSEKNLGMIPNYVQTLNACHGQYIALLDGDDYWIDALKLQKQIDFLDTNIDFSMCCHLVKYIDERGMSLNRYSWWPDHKDFYTIEDLFTYCNFISTPSVVFQRGLFGDFPDWFYQMKFPDWLLHILNALHGKIGFIPEVMCIYRIHSGGAYSGENTIINKEKKIWMYNHLNVIFNYKYNTIIEKALAFHTAKLAIEYNKIKSFIKARECIRDYFRNFMFDKSLIKIYLITLFHNFLSYLD
jgi:glycosyltransferase involved in cell wall biosynthesis